MGMDETHMRNGICKVCKTDHKVGPAYHAFQPIENKRMFNETPIFNATVKTIQQRLEENKIAASKSPLSIEDRKRLQREWSEIDPRISTPEAEGR